MSNSEDLVIVESTDYAQVVFDDVRDCFSYDKPLNCVFTLNNLLKADKSDWIGIYKVYTLTLFIYLLKFINLKIKKGWIHKLQ